MKIYIASSWRNQHGVEMLTTILRDKGHEVISWIENNYGELATIKTLSFESWMLTEGAERSFEFDTNGAANCDLFIYYSPAGQDACVELGIAWANKIPILGLFAKGEGLGLMRKCVHHWFERVTDLIECVESLNKTDYVKQENPSACEK